MLAFSFFLQTCTNLKSGDTTVNSPMVFRNLLVKVLVFNFITKLLQFQWGPKIMKHLLHSVA